MATSIQDEEGIEKNYSVPVSLFVKKIDSKIKEEWVNKVPRELLFIGSDKIRYR